MKKIIHLSDLHLGYESSKNNLNTLITFKEMTGRILKRCSPANEYVIVITGDIVDDATQQKNLLAAQKALQPLIDNYEVLIAPGNHDYGNGNRADKTAMNNFKELILHDSEITFPQLKCIDGIAFIGLDSMQGEMKKGQGLWADGEIGEGQLETLDSLLTTDPDVQACAYRVIYLHHHPFEHGKYFKRKFHGLDDADGLKTVLDRHNNGGKHKIDALLFGHNHGGKPWYMHWGIPRAYDAGSTTGKRGVIGPHREIDLSRPISPDEDIQLETDL